MFCKPILVEVLLLRAETNLNIVPLVLMLDRNLDCLNIPSRRWGVRKKAQNQAFSCRSSLFHYISLPNLEFTLLASVKKILISLE